MPQMTQDVPENDLGGSLLFPSVVHPSQLPIWRTFSGSSATVE